MSKMPLDVEEKLLIWVDDVVIGAKIVEELLQNILKILDFCVAVNFKLHLQDCRFFKNFSYVAQNNIFSEGVRYDPRHESALKNMATSMVARKLLQIMYAMQ